MLPSGWKKTSVPVEVEVPISRLNILLEGIRSGRELPRKINEAKIGRLDLPTHDGLELHFNTIYNKIIEIFNIEIVLDNNNFSISELLNDYVGKIFFIPKFFIERRNLMRRNCLRIMNCIYNVEYSNKSFVRESFSNVLSMRTLKNANLYNDLFNEFCQKCEDLSIRINKRSLNARFDKGDIVDNYDITKRFDIFNKFSKYILIVKDIDMYETVVKCFSYFLYSELNDNDIYQKYINNNYSTIINSSSRVSASRSTEVESILTEAENRIIDRINTSISTRQNYVVLNSSKDEKIKEYNAIESDVQDKTSLLISRFIEYVSTIDIVVKSYQDRKVSYDSSDREFKDIIDNLETKIVSIKNNYSDISNVSIQIMLIIFNSNFDIYKIKKLLFNVLKYTIDDIVEFNNILASTKNLLERYSDLSYDEKVIQLNMLLDAFGLNVKSNSSQINDVLYKYTDLNQRSKVKSDILSFLFVNHVSDFINNKTDEIKEKLNVEKFKEIELQTFTTRPKLSLNGKKYGYEINEGLIGKNIDNLTYHNIKSLSNNIIEFVKFQRLHN